MDIAALEEYLRRYPSGHFAELAQMELNRELARQGEKRIVVASQEGNPYTKGSAEASTSYQVGDSYTFRDLELFSRVEQQTFTTVITQVTDSEVIYSGGFISDLLGNARRFPDGRRLSPNQNYPADFSVGKRWQSRFITFTPRGEGDTTLEFHIAAREIVTVPAGTFNAFRVESHGYSTIPGVGRMTLQSKFWFAPDKVRLPVARENTRKAGNFRYVEASRRELVAFKETRQAAA